MIVHAHCTVTSHEQLNNMKNEYMILNNGETTKKKYIQLNTNETDDI